MLPSIPSSSRWTKSHLRSQASRQWDVARADTHTQPSRARYAGLQEQQIAALSEREDQRGKPK